MIACDTSDTCTCVLGTARDTLYISRCMDHRHRSSGSMRLPLWQPLPTSRWVPRAPDLVLSATRSATATAAQLRLAPPEGRFAASVRRQPQCEPSGGSCVRTSADAPANSRRAAYAIAETNVHPGRGGISEAGVQSVRSIRPPGTVSGCFSRGNTITSADLDTCPVASCMTGSSHSCACTQTGTRQHRCTPRTPAGVFDARN